MATHDGLYWYKNVLRKQLKLALRIYLSLSIVLSPIFLMNTANAAVGGWTLGGGVAQGASTVYNGTKQVIIDGKEYIKKGTAIITPTATGVAKVLARGVAGVALSVAVEQLLGAVDWVLDPANNRIVYSVEKQPEEQLCNQTKKCETEPTIFKCQYTNYSSCNKTYSSPKAAIAALFKEVGVDASVTSCDLTTRSCTLSKATPYGNQMYFTAIANPNYDPQANEEEDEIKTLPLEVVAQKVISNAAGSDAAAQVATTAAAADIVSEAETDNTKARPIAQQLESSSSTKPADEAAAAEANTATGTQTQNPTKPEATDLKLEFPAFCGWAPIVCEAAQKVISFPITLTQWWETANSKAEQWATSISQAWASAKEWATSEPQKEDSNELEIEELDLGADEVNLSGSNNCPQDSVSFSVMGKSVSLDMPYQPLCDALNFFKPAVLLVGAVASVYIVAGVRTKEEEQ